MLKIQKLIKYKINLYHVEVLCTTYTKKHKVQWV